MSLVDRLGQDWLWSKINGHSHPNQHSWRLNCWAAPKWESRKLLVKVSGLEKVWNWDPFSFQFQFCSFSPTVKLPGSLARSSKPTASVQTFSSDVQCVTVRNTPLLSGIQFKLLSSFLRKVQVPLSFWERLGKLPNNRISTSWRNKAIGCVWKP